MWGSPVSTPISDHGLRRSMSDQNVQDFFRELQAHIDQIASRRSSTIADSGFSVANCLLPLNLSQSRCLAGLATTFVQHSTWWSIREASDSWVLCGEVGEDSGPRVTVFITATSDRDVVL